MRKTHTSSRAVLSSTSSRRSTAGLVAAAAGVALFASGADAQCVRFGERTDYPLMLISAFSAADIDGDKDIDILVGTQAHGNDVRVLRNDGTGAFTDELLYDVTAAVGGVAAGDVNGDGFTDIVFSEANVGLRVMLNLGDATYGPPTTYGTVGAKVQLADLDGDGDLDGYAPGNMALIWINDGAGAFADPVHYASMAQDMFLDLVAADLNGDGRLDLVGANFGGSDDEGDAVQMLLNNGDGTFGKAQGLTPGVSAIHSVLAADLDGDGDQDIAYSHEVPTARVRTLMNNGDATFVEGVWTPTTYTPRAMIAADFDADKDADIALGLGFLDASGSFGTHVNNGDATVFTNLPRLSVYPLVIDILTADFNGDGKPDVALATYRFWPSPENGYVSVFMNESGAPLTEMNSDGVVNSTDVSEFINLWLEDQAEGTLDADFDGNGVVNSTDVSEFINVWFVEVGGSCG